MTSETQIPYKRDKKVEKSLEEQWGMPLRPLAAYHKRRGYI